MDLMCSPFPEGHDRESKEVNIVNTMRKAFIRAAGIGGPLAYLVLETAGGRLP